ncbi:universal stress protein [Snuella sedimenti]|uniref:Universal stress protein n=1 Tax=Snuella sedimenti TaxID=2798802 RepID=A0A8J7LMF9_9FLAO|nr:universal stress protein [Snuella sedimenti]MBJ6367494.1 universal stress protein [Snuella sedimenti]
MKKILLPTDFSENSWNAIAYALQFFKHDICRFYLLNTYTPVVYHVEYVLANPTQYGLGDAVREASLEALSALENRINNTFRNANHSFESISAFNTLIPEIKDVVKEKNINYIVMGTTGATGAKEVLFGTNTVHVFKNMTCPVLAIPKDFTFEHPQDILFPTDYEIDYDEHQMQSIVQIASRYDSKVHVLNVSYGYDLSHNQKSNKQKLESLIKKVPHVFHSVSNQTVQEAIANFQLSTRVNLLTMINNKHSFFENVFFKSKINQIGFHLKVPFLVIPSKNK